MADEIREKFTAYKRALNELKEKEMSVQTALVSLKSAANKSTFEVDGEYFQIRSRQKDGKVVYYLCTLDGPPKGRPKKTEAVSQ